MFTQMNVKRSTVAGTKRSRVVEWRKLNALQTLSFAAEDVAMQNTFTASCQLRQLRVLTVSQLSVRDAAPSFNHSGFTLGY